MIRGLGWCVAIGSLLAPPEKQGPPAARAGTYYGRGVGVVMEIGFGAVEPGGAGLILGMRFAGCRGFPA